MVPAEAYPSGDDAQDAAREDVDAMVLKGDVAGRADVKRDAEGDQHEDCAKHRGRGGAVSGLAFFVVIVFAGGRAVAQVRDHHVEF